MKKSQKNRQSGITLIALVITIMVLIILAGIAISMTVGDNGIFTKAKEAKRLQITSEAKEKIGTEILAAQVEATERNEKIEQAQLEDIISKYGILQDDKDTIVLKDNGYEISLLDIYQGTTTDVGSYSANKAKIELLEGQVKSLQEQLDSMSKKVDEKEVIEKLKSFLSLKIKDETNYTGIKGYRAILDNSSQKIKSVTVKFKRSTTYGYLKLDYSQKYISGYTDQTDSNFKAIAKYTDVDEHIIKIDMLGHNYLNIADAHAGVVPTVTVEEIEFAE